MAHSPVDVANQIVEPADVPYWHLADAFGRVVEAGSTPARLDVRVAGFHVRIRVAGESLAAELFSPLRHLPAVDGGRPDLAIDVLDGTATAEDFSPPPAGGGGKLGIVLKASVDGRFVGEERDHTRIWLDRSNSRIVGWYGSRDTLNLDERARPFHKMLSAWLEERGVQFVHAGLVTVEGQGVLFVGNGGAGKSTSSIACLRAGMGYLGDDFIGFSELDKGFIGHGIYGTCLLNVAHIRRFPDLERISHAPNHAFEDKRIMYLHRGYPGALQSRVKIRALLLPKVAGGETTRTRPASRAEALMAIAPTSVMFLPRPSQAAFRRVSGLVEALPCFWLELGTDVDAIPDAVEALARSLQDTSATPDNGDLRCQTLST